MHNYRPHEGCYLKLRQVHTAARYIDLDMSKLSLPEVLHDGSND
jgi:hypothetical protein